MAAYSAVERGKNRVSPAQLGLAVLASRTGSAGSRRGGADDHGSALADGARLPGRLFSQGTFFNFRQRMLNHGLD